jgi:TPP-dependent pyruvate/acetoin dehydrogenase alpha subunit
MRYPNDADRVNRGFTKPESRLSVRNGNIDPVPVYRAMKLIRRVEERLVEEYHVADEMRCPMHFCIGQESTPAVLAPLLRRSDVMMSHYRSHGYFLAKGGSLAGMIAEFFGKATGTNRGMAGSMELGSHEHNFFSGAIVGGSLLIPLGAAFAQQRSKSDAISIAVMGDGSFDEGITYESMNLAALYRLPLLILCENNHYAANTAVADRLGRPELVPKAAAMGIEAASVDGYDLAALSTSVADAVAALRAGHGPRFLEVNTYRFCAHVGPTSDDYLEYRTTEEIGAWQAKDPLAALHTRLVADPAVRRQVAEIDDEIEREIDAAFAAARAAPFPSFDPVLAMNCSDSYAPVAEGYFKELRPAFTGGQRETRLEPF